MFFLGFKIIFSFTVLPFLPFVVAFPRVVVISVIDSVVVEILPLLVGIGHILKTPGSLLKFKQKYSRKKNRFQNFMTLRRICNDFTHIFFQSPKK